MENERGQGRSLSSGFTQPNISEDPNDEREKEACAHVRFESWDKYFLARHDFLKMNGVVNLPRTRVAVLSGTDVDLNNDFTIETVLSKETLRNKERWEEDKDKVSRLESSLDTNHMKFTVFDLGDYFHDFQNMTREDRRNGEKRIIKDIKNFYPNLKYNL